MPEPKKIAIVVSAASSYARSVVEGVHAYARQGGPFEFYIDFDIARPRAMRDLKRAAGRLGFDGILADIWRRIFLEDILKVGVPVVDVSGTWNPADVPSVHVDNAAAGRMVARYFLDKGLSHFAFCGTGQPLHCQQRQKAFASELAKAGYECDVFLYNSGREVRLDDQERVLEEWLASLPKPVGLMCWFDLRVRDIVHACRRAGIAIPHEVAIVGVDNDELAGIFCNLPVSSVDVSPKHIGYRAMALLDKMIRGAPKPASHVLVRPSRLVSRASSDMVAVANADVAAAVRYIEDHAGEPMQIKELLRVVPISRRALEVHFRNLYGRTPHQQLLHLRVERAKALLVESDLDLAAIALRTGFREPSPFSVTFRKLTGMTPRDYRKRNRLR